MTDAFHNPHPEVPFASVGDDIVKALADLAAILKLKLQQAPSLATHASPVTVVQLPSLIPSDENPHSRHPRQAITTEGGHTSDTTSFTSEGAHWIPATLATQPVPR
jgi:hypothetical protein